jgi:hypothetical protein
MWTWLYDEKRVISASRPPRIRVIQPWISNSQTLPKPSPRRSNYSTRVLSRTAQAEWRRWPGGLQPGEASIAGSPDSLERHSGRLIGQLGQFGDYEGEESPVEDRGFELDKCSLSKRASLDSIAASRAFSLLSCFIRCS